MTNQYIRMRAAPAARPVGYRRPTARALRGGVGVAGGGGRGVVSRAGGNREAEAGCGCWIRLSRGQDVNLDKTGRGERI